MIDTTTLNQRMSAAHGRDVNITLARNPSWGHRDYCLLINGRNHRSVCRELAQHYKDKGHKTMIETNESPPNTLPSFSYSILTMQASN